MSFDPIYLIYGALFVGALFLVEGVYHVFLDPRVGSQDHLNRRMRMLAAGTEAHDVLRRLRRKPPGAASFGTLWPSFESLLTRAGMTISTNHLVGVMLALAIIVFAGAYGVAKVNLWLSLGLAVSFGFVLPFVYVVRRGASRLNKFGEQLPDALDIIVRSLHSGHPINSAIAMVAEEMPDPIGSEFGIAVDEITYGLDLRQALENMSLRIDHQDLQYIIISIKIQHGTGGNLAEVLTNVSTVIRRRFQMYRKIKAISAEGRWSAYILSALPFVVAGAVMIINPAYYKGVEDDPLFPIFMIGGLVIMIFGIIVMWRLVKIRV